MKQASVTLTRRLNAFFKAEYSGGILMLVMAMAAMIAANGPTAELYQLWIHWPVRLGFGVFSLTEPLAHWVSDLLMVLFFLVVGMELKREMLEGVLSDKKQVLLPLLAAIGGMAVPAVIFLLVNYHLPENWNGWAIPSATDIAFAVCVVMLVGKHLPPALKVFLLAIAICDDMGAIVIIALFYSKALVLIPLLLAFVVMLLLYLLNRSGVMALSAYIVLGMVLVCCLYYGGIHTTVAGIAVGMAIPLRHPRHPFHSPLHDCMDRLHPWVSFIILPLFAFTAAGVNLRGITLQSLYDPLVLGVALGLWIGKPLGILGTSWCVVALGMSSLPEGTSWRHIYGISIIAGIGFTMSLFINLLAFDDSAMQQQVKLGIMLGSLLAAIMGWIVLRRAIKHSI